MACFCNFRYNSTSELSITGRELRPIFPATDNPVSLYFFRDSSWVFIESSCNLSSYFSSSAYSIKILSSCRRFDIINWIFVLIISEGNTMSNLNLRKGKHLTIQNHKDCDKKHICTESCDRLCKKCKMVNCYRTCPDYSSKRCVELSRFPYVCIGCIRTIACNTERYLYRTKVGHANYQELLKSSREGLNITPGELTNLDNIIERRLGRYLRKRQTKEPISKL
jgi:hypothetical protein